jgi:hypothetical protein
MKHLIILSLACAGLMAQTPAPRKFVAPPTEEDRQRDEAFKEKIAEWRIDCESKNTCDIVDYTEQVRKSMLGKSHVEQLKILAAAMVKIKQYERDAEEYQIKVWCPPILQAAMDRLNIARAHCDDLTTQTCGLTKADFTLIDKAEECSAFIDKVKLEHPLYFLKKGSN